MSEQQGIPRDEDDAVHLATEGDPKREAAPDPAAFEEGAEHDDEDGDA